MDEGIKASRHQGIEASRHQGIKASWHQGIKASWHRGIEALGKTRAGAPAAKHPTFRRFFSLP